MPRIHASPQSSDASSGIAVTKYMIKELSLLFPYMTLKELTIASYNMGYYPYRYDADFTLSWVPKYCFDCRLSGGKIDKPTGWD